MGSGMFLRNLWAGHQILCISVSLGMVSSPCRSPGNVEESPVLLSALVQAFPEGQKVPENVKKTQTGRTSLWKCSNSASDPAREKLEHEGTRPYWELVSPEPLSQPLTDEQDILLLGTQPWGDSPRVNSAEHLKQHHMRKKNSSSSSFLEFLDFSFCPPCPWLILKLILKYLKADFEDVLKLI